MDFPSFAVAQMFADAAASIDGLKNYAPECERAQYAQQAQELHDAAQELAGDRVHELYCPEDVHA